MKSKVWKVISLVSALMLMCCLLVSSVLAEEALPGVGGATPAAGGELVSGGVSGESGTPATGDALATGGTSANGEGSVNLDTTGTDQSVVNGGNGTAAGEAQGSASNSNTGNGTEGQQGSQGSDTLAGTGSEVTSNNEGSQENPAGGAAGQGSAVTPGTEQNTGSSVATSTAVTPGTVQNVGSSAASGTSATQGADTAASQNNNSATVQPAAQGTDALTLQTPQENTEDKKASEDQKNAEEKKDSENKDSEEKKDSKDEEEKEKESEEDLKNFSLECEFEDSEVGEAYLYAGSDELLTEYMGMAASGNIGVSETIPMLFASAYNGNKLSGLTQVMYNQLKSKVVAVAAGNDSSTSVSLSLGAADFSGLRWTASDLGVSTLFGNDARTSVNKDAAQKAIDSLYNPSLAVKSLIRDCPYEMFWFGNQYNMNKTYKPKITYDATLQDFVMTIESCVFSIDLKASADYMGDSVYSVNIGKVQSIHSAMNNAAGIIAAGRSMGDDAKMSYFRDQICNLVSYNTSAAGSSYASGYGNPWQLIYVFDGDPNTNVVCEGYAKAFQYLCDECGLSSGVYVYSVAGSFQVGSRPEEGHLWNIVRRGGKNYLVDLTNYDGNRSAGLFMSQANSGSIDGGYVFNVNGSNYTYRYNSDTRLIYSDYELNMKEDTVTPAQPAQSSQTQPAPTPAAQTQPMQTQPAINFTRNLSQGMQGEDVRQLQKVLASLGYYSGTMDGDYGSYTVAAVKRFQQANGCIVDGGVGAQTRAALNKILGATSGSSANTNTGTSTNTNTNTNNNTVQFVLTRNLSTGSQGADVKQLQQLMKNLGLYSGTVDGDYGSYTASAVSAFQRKYGLYVDGMVGSQTAQMLNRLAGGSGNASTNQSTTNTNTAGNTGTSAAYTFTRNLSYGLQGSDVSALQQILAKLGYSVGSIDGYFGNYTLAAVKAFQADYGLIVDGVAAGQTFGKLNALTGGVAGTSGNTNNTNRTYASMGTIVLTRHLNVGSTGEDVRAVQQKLKNLGYSIYVDGVYGVNTQAAVQAFQSANGLIVDGFVGSQTIAVLNTK